MRFNGARRAAGCALAALALGACGGDGQESPPLSTSAPPVISGPGACREDDRFDGDGRDHADDVEYKVNPPAGGDHHPRAVPPGIYKRGQVPDGAFVHAMERGDVVIWHTALAPEDEAQVHELAKRFPKVVLVVPRAGMDAPVVATRWHKRLLCQGLDVDALATWIEANQNLGPKVSPD